VVESSLDKFLVDGECSGATWTSHRFPHGTHLLVDYLGKMVLDSRGVEIVTSGPGGERFGKVGLPIHLW